VDRPITGLRTADGTVPPYSIPRGDRPVTGQAVPRTTVQTPTSRNIYITSPYFGSYGYSPWGYGAFGLGYFYYDPFLWGYPSYGYPYGYGYPSYGYGYPSYGSSYSSYGYGYTGAIRLKVKPRDAMVYVDGYYVGVVDDFDGIFQRLTLETGPHRLEIRADGYEPLVFEVRIEPDHTITYHGELKRKLVP
jgi:hypothetical protein